MICASMYVWQPVSLPQCSVLPSAGMDWVSVHRWLLRAVAILESGYIISLIRAPANG